MVITYLGMAFVKVQFGDAIVAFNPLGKNAELSGARFGADIALMSLRDPNYNGVENLAYGDRQPFIISGPGEYEVQGIYVKGVPSKGPDGKINTIYSVLLEGITLCHLGGLAATDVAADAIEAIGEVDVLFVPAYGHGTLSPKDGDKAIGLFEPKIVIPLYYGAKNQKEQLAVFLKEVGEDGGEKLDKLTLKKKDLEGKEADVMVLTAQV